MSQSRSNPPGRPGPHVASCTCRWCTILRVRERCACGLLRDVDHQVWRPGRAPGENGAGTPERWIRLPRRRASRGIGDEASMRATACLAFVVVGLALAVLVVPL